MHKYFEIFKATINQYFVYRLSFVLWRFRVILNLILIYFLWNSVYDANRIILGYTKTEMISYVLIITFLSNVVFSSKIHEISGEILNGNIINQLLKPFSVIQNVMMKEAVDKLVNIVFSLVEIAILILVMRPNVFIQTDIIVLATSFLFLLIGMGIAFFISFCISMIAFWTAEIWAPRFIYFILVFMLAGNYFPLDIIPANIYNILLYTPFPYFIFIPAKIYLHGLTENTLQLFIISSTWVLLTYWMAKTLWQKGMKEFSFYGR